VLCSKFLVDSELLVQSVSLSRLQAGSGVCATELMIPSERNCDDPEQMYAHRAQLGDLIHPAISRENSSCRRTLKRDVRDL
jgi:hypothetical protein